MARHRNFKNDVLEERSEHDNDDFPYSVEEDSCLSPGTAQFMYNRNRTDNPFLSSFVLPEKVPEVDEDYANAGYVSTQPPPRPNIRVDAASGSGQTTDGRVTPRTVQPTTKKITTGFTPAAQDTLALPDKRVRDLVKDSDSNMRKSYSDKALHTRVNDLSLDERIAANVAAPSGSGECGLVMNSPRRDRAASPCTSRPETPIHPKARIKDRPGGAKPLLNMVVVGHVDAGKSTLMGHLLVLLGNVNQRVLHKNKQESQKIGKSSFAFAWALDETTEERERGVTMDIAQTKFETPTKQVVLLDAPGHKDFIPNMITGAAQADVAILVVNATRGEFETGFEFGGQTREHTMLVRSLGVSQLAVAVNKLDTVNWSQDRFQEIQEKLRPFLRQTGFQDCTFVPCSGLGGDNLLVKPAAGHLLAEWYSGPTLFEVIDGFKLTERSVDKPLRLCISDVYKGMGSGIQIAGKCETGAVQKDDKVVVMPNGDSALVKGVQTDEALDAGVAYAGDQCLLTLFGLELANVSRGHVLCHPESPVPSVTRFEARLVVFNIAVPITTGFPVRVAAVLHYQCVCEPVTVVRLINQLNKSTGEVIKQRPRCLTKNSSGSVEICCEKPLCLDLYQHCKELGRVTLRAAGQTIAAGTVTKLFM